MLAFSNIVQIFDALLSFWLLFFSANSSFGTLAGARARDSHLRSGSSRSNAAARLFVNEWVWRRVASTADVTALVDIR